MSIFIAKCGFMKKAVFMLCVCLLISSCAVPTVVIKGTVYDENDCPLSGSIVFTSKDNGVIADSSGHYSIIIPRKGKTTIHFKALGYYDLDLEYSPSNLDGLSEVKMQPDSTLFDSLIIRDWFPMK